MKKLFIAMLAVAAMLFYACEQKQQVRLGELSDTEYSQADSLVFEGLVKRGPESAYRLIDSLEQTGDLSALGADVFRAIAYNRYFRRTDYDANAEELNRRAFSHKVAQDERRWYYNYAGNEYAYYLYMRHNYDGFLRVAVPLLASMDSTGSGTIDEKVNLYSMIGCCYVKLEQPDKAREVCKKARAYCWEVLAQDSSTGIHQLFINNYARIKDAYVRVRDWEKVREWMAFNDSIGKLFKQRHPEAPVWAIYDGYTHLDRAIKVWSLGRTDSAATEYAEFRKYECAYTPNGLIQSNDYLMPAERWADAADNYQALDWFINKPYMEEIYAYYFPKFRANFYAGRKDSALFVANQIAEFFDSAYIWQKRSQMAEMATIYDTQGKEMQIARQQAELSQERLLGTAIALVLLTTFFVIYTLHRRRSEKRLSAAHVQLQQAYDQLEETTAAKERIESELRIARDIQMSMVPGVFPSHSGLDMYASMTPAKEVGGDLYGYVLQGENLYFCVGDVSGKGVPASLFMAQSARLFRTLSAEGMTPADIAVRMNNELSEGNDSNMFVTMFIGLLHLDSGSLEFCNCGHNPPVVDAEFMQMTYYNQPLGIMDGIPFHGESVADMSGHQILIYTDGLNEAENLQHEQLGDSRMLELIGDASGLTSTEVIDRLKEKVEQHRVGAEPNDDLTLMCINFTATAILSAETK